MLTRAGVLLFVLSSAARAQSISITPDGGFGFLPLASFGTEPVSGVGDNTSHDFDVPAFLWGGLSYTSLSMSSNGYLVIGGGDASSSANQSLPSSSTPNNVLAPFWTDLALGASGRLSTELLSGAGETWAVFEWQDMGIASHPALLNSFQVWIGLNGVEDITYVYGDMAGSGGAPYTVGAENSNGAIGAMWSYNGDGEPSPDSEFGLRVSSTGSPNVIAVPEPASLALLAFGFAIMVAARRRVG